MSRLWLAMLACACGDPAPRSDAGLDAQARLSLDIDGPAALQLVRSVTVSITASGFTRMDSIPVNGLPATVDVPRPIQLSDWSIEVDGFDAAGQMIGRGMTVVPSGTTAATVTLAPIL